MTNLTLNYCTIHIYNQTNNHLLRQNLTFENPDWSVELTSAYTNKIGVYPYTVWCEGEEEGYLSTEYFVSQDGVTFDGRGYSNLSLTLLMIFIISSYLAIGLSWDFTLFEAGKNTKNNAIKGLIIWLMIWLIPGIIQFGVEIAEGFGATNDMVTLFNLLYQVSIWIGVTISIYFAVFFVYNVLLYLAGKGGEMNR